VRKGGSRSPSFTITTGEGLTDEEIVDAFAHLLLSLSVEKPAIAPATGAEPVSGGIGTGRFLSLP